MVGTNVTRPRLDFVLHGTDGVDVCLPNYLPTKVSLTFVFLLCWTSTLYSDITSLHYLCTYPPGSTHDISSRTVQSSQFQPDQRVQNQAKHIPEQTKCRCRDQQRPPIPDLPKTHPIVPRYNMSKTNNQPAAELRLQQQRRSRVTPRGHRA